ncbi:hypothetical protein DFH09DRAFT_1371721 [Mycena vulgaris]|nr:hypothetical protein DFH09DRAFT_1371721 [Mycena vulgaris]
MERALATAANASTSALTAAGREISPASPFAQLLRQSRFATYDPQIRKTYYSPRQFVERGYWGLKRPITQRKKNSFLTIKQWEARQHYVEWDNSEDEVRFIRRMEELDMHPGMRLYSPWAQTLGPAKRTWLIDSEFCPRQWEPVEADKEAAVMLEEEQVMLEEQQAMLEEEYAMQKEAVEQEEGEGTEVWLDSLGKRGRTGYGKQGLRRTPNSVIPNVHSMSPGQFERYLAKLRTLRPVFAAYIERESERQKENAKAGKAAPLAGKTLAQIARLPSANVHRIFLAQHTEAEYASTSKIQPQPHRTGAFLYHHPTALDTLFRTASKPGIVLQVKNTTGRFADRMRDKQQSSDYVVSFAGIAATLPRGQAEGKTPLMDPAAERERWPTAVAEMRPTRLALERVPRVVGPGAQGLRGVRVELDVTAKRGFDDPGRPNPYLPGSRMYVAIESVDQPRGADIARKPAESAARARLVGNAPIKVNAAYVPPPTPVDPLGVSMSARERERNATTLGLLQNLLGAAAKQNDKVGDHEL